MCKFKLTYEDKKREYHIQNTIYKKIYKNIYSNYHTLWDNLFKNKNQFVSIHFDMIKYLIEKEKLKEENQICNIINNEVFIKIFKYRSTQSLPRRALCGARGACGHDRPRRD
jgi:hypothetical protein